MAIFDDQGGFGLRLFKSSDEAYREDVVPKSKRDEFGAATEAFEAFSSQSSKSPSVQVADASGGMSWREQLGALQKAAPAASAVASSALEPSSGGWRDQLRGLETPAAPEQGNFSRGFEVSGKQLKQTAYGTAALIGDTVGADKLKDWGLKGYQEAAKEVQKISKETDSFTTAFEKGELGQWLTYSSGYLVGQVAEMGAASIAGAVAGSFAAPGAGTVAGALTGAVEKGAVQTGVKTFVGKMIDKQMAANVARGMSQEAAASAAVKSVYGKIGATTANTFLNATQELGSIYGDAVEEAALTGKEYSLGKVWLAGVAATAVDSWADSVGLGKLVGAAGGDKAIRGVAMEALKGGFREGMTEGVQTAIERWGANKDTTSKEAFREYIDSAAVGILGGGVAGGATGALNKVTSGSDTTTKGGPAPGETTEVSADPDKNQPQITAPVGIEKGELLRTMKNMDAMAYLYDSGDEAQKASIERAVQRAGLIAEFDQAKGNVDAIRTGESQLAAEPLFVDTLRNALDTFGKTQPTDGKVKFAPRDNTPPPSQFDQADAEQLADMAPADTNKAAMVSKSAVPVIENTNEDLAIIEPENTEVAQTTEAAPAPAPVAIPNQPSAEYLEAKQKFKDAAAQALDIAMDVSGSKLNITGKQYTAKDLPKAIQRVMEALVEMGYYKLKDISTQVMLRMRDNENWKDLADQVTPFMLRQAYKKIAPFENKESNKQVDSFKARDLFDIITYKPDNKQAPLPSEMGKATGAMKGGQADTTIDSDIGEAGDKGLSNDEIEYDKYVAKPDKPKRKSISVGKITPAIREYLSTLSQADQKEAMLTLGGKTDEELKRFEDQLVASKQQKQEREAEAQRGKTGELDVSVENTEIPDFKTFRQKIDSILNMRAETQFFRDTLARMQAAIDEIDATLRGNKVIEEDGKKFEAVNESDENAYLWEAFGTAKDLPQDKLLALRRKLVDEVRDMQSKSISGQAQLFKSSMKRIEYELSIARTKALQSGLDMGPVDAIYEPARNSVIAMMREMKGKNKEQQVVPEQYQDKIFDAIQEDFLAKEKTVLQLIQDLKDGKINDVDAFTFAAKAIREGLFSEGELRQEMRRQGIDMPHQMIGVTSQVAMQTRMLDHVKANDYKPMFRDAWLRSMDTIVNAYPGTLDGDMFTDGEKLAYEEWKESRATFQARRKIDEVMQYSNDVNEAFKGLLFVDFTLGRMRNTDTIPPRTLGAMKDSVGDLPEAWLQDVAFALQTRPDLRNQITEMIRPDEMAEFKKWIQRKEDQVNTAAEVTAMLPYYQQLSNMDALPDEVYERVRKEIARGRILQLDQIMANAKRLNDAIGGRNLSDKDLEFLLADYMERVQAEEDINGQTIEQFFGMDEGGRQAIDTREESVEDMANSDEGFDFNDDTDSEQNSEDRFKRGFFNGVVTAAHVQTVVARITSKWKNAPQITVLQNASMLPEPLRTRVMERLGANMGAKGLFDSETGQVYLFSDMLAGEADTEFTLFHEVYGHMGLRAFLGTKFDSFLKNMYNAYPRIKAEVDAVMEAEGLPLLEAIDEVISDFAGKGQQIPAVKAWVGKILAGLREIGLGRVADWMAKQTNAELAYYLKGAQDAAQNGGYNVFDGAPGVIRLAEERLPYELFSLKGDTTAAYSRFNPVTQTWAVFKATGEDIRNGYTAVVMDKYEDVLEFMRKAGYVERRKRSGVFVDDKLPGDMPKMSAATDVTGMKRWMRDLITRYQNEYKPVFDVVDYLRGQGRLTDRMDVKTALLLYERKTGAVVEHFRRNFVEPVMKLVNEAKEQGADYDLINRFLLARHAEERNKQIARVNPKMQDGGSGMTTAEAKAFLKSLEKNPAFDTLQEIGRMTDKMSDQKLKYQVNTGMITIKQANAMRAAYKNYVNLSGLKEGLDGFDDPSRLAGGSKFNVKGKEQRAMGRESEATDILGRTILGMEAALIRGQKNLVAQRVLALVEANYDPNFAVVNEIAYKKVIGEDGMVTEQEDAEYIRRKDVMVAKINGIPATIRFKDTERGSFADAIHGMVYPPDSSPWLARLGQFNQILGQMLTTWNPAWVAINFTRDVQTMYFNAASDGRITKAQAAQMVKALPGAIKTALYMASNGKLNINVDPEMVRIYNEMKRAGGLTSFLNRKDLEEQVNEIHQMLGERTKAQKVGDKFKGILNLMEYMTLPMEIAPRLAAYKIVRDNGFTADQAAVFSGEITVNFNMRGSVKEMRQLFLFFNPAVQGSAKMVALARNNPGRLSGYAFAFAGLGAMANLIARATGDDDEAGRSDLDKVPVYKRATSIVIAPDVPGGAIPIPYGWNAFYAFGHFMMDSILGVQPLDVTAKRIAKTAFEAYTPLGTAGLDSKSMVGTVLKGVSPTATLPIVEWVMNENRFGAPIRKEGDQFGGAVMPDSQMAFRSVSPISKSIAEGLNELTGGNKYKAGAIDVNPAAIDFIIGSYTPGLINETYKGASTAARIARGEDVKNTPLPLIDRFTAKTPEGFDAGAFRRAKELIETRYNEYKNMPELRDEIRKDVPGLMRAHAVVAATTQEIRELRSRLAKLEKNENIGEAEKVARLNLTRERETALYNRAVKAVMDAGPEFREAVMAAD